ncbi:hypothetical protein SteCoe_30626 [Stentor coeruleus]|uniref:Uncharacterized protein n=1 Tax=Stentor coeruleus TaxID=5963 RepID=A0A1R2B3B3_9CILI|nr:hypothetical protein SteCoe_30626 [Stentor coeruleus]
MDDAQRSQCYKDLFSKSYIENSALESEEISKQEEQILEKLDADEVFENLKDLVDSLLQFKKSVRTSENHDVFDTLKQYENSFKDLEEEFAILENENLNLKSSNNEYQEKIETLEKSISYLSQRMVDLEKALKERDLELTRIKNPNKNDFYMSFQQNSKGLKLEDHPEDLKNNHDDILKPKGFTTPHRRHMSFANFKAPESSQKRQTIKSVKFEYFVNTTKAADKTINIKTHNKNIQSDSHEPKIVKKTHSRSTSDVQLIFKKPS